MRATVTVVTPQVGVVASLGTADAIIEAPGAAASGDVVAALRRLAGVDDATPAWIDGAPVDDMTPISASALRDGAIVTLGANHGAPGRASARSAQRGCLELRVVGGPDAGGVYPLAAGTVTIGRGAGNGVRLDDPDVSRRHVALAVTTDAVRVADAGSTNGTTLDGVPVGAKPVEIRPGMRLRLGESTLILAVPDQPPIGLAPGADGTLGHNRPPRLDAATNPPAVEFPAEPDERAPARLPLVATIAPVVAGVALALMLRRPEYLLFTVLSPVMMVGQWLADRVGGRRARRAERAAYEAKHRAARAALATAITDDESRRRRDCPDAATLRAIATAPSARLWERRRTDRDFAQLRLGLGDLPAEVEVRTNGDARGKRVAHDVPVTVRLADVGVLGVAGPPGRTASLARFLIGQLAVLHSPRDLGVVLLTEPARAPWWEWVRWLPHTRPAAGAACQALVGLDPDTVAARVAEIGALITSRRDSAGRASESARRAVVVIVDGARALRGTPGLADLLSLGPDAGVLAVCLDTEESRLPEECGAVATFTGAMATRVGVRVGGAPAVMEAIADGVRVDWAERVARALAPVRDGSRGAGGEGLPDAVRWRDLAGLAGGDGLGEELLERWRRHGHGSTAALVGVGVDGPFSVDIARDGPHALVAGTTGSGKSELLQTLVASLAVANRPDQLTFVLVDYKGGAAFGSCAALPHTVGLVTDLDGSLVERALVSLGAELKRREALLADAGAANIDGYRAGGHSLARLVIVVDEFASLAEELPDFVGGLVGIAQRGRSLGVHLVLATQRPEGVVSADIRANTNLRVCLAVMREAESRDVIDAPDAARISRATPGRGYVRTGHGELRAFQSGRVGGAARADDGDRICARRLPFRALAAAPTVPASPPGGGREQAKTDLDLIVDACREAATRLGVETPASPWLAPLPAVLAIDQSETPPLTARLGVRDVPARQAREPYVVDLATTSHLVIAGSARSGRTTALRSLAGLLARSTRAADLHMYAFDCGGGALAALDSLPHCGAVVSAHEPDRARRLISLLSAELTSRQSAFSAGGFTSISEQRAATTGAAAGAGVGPLPHAVVFIDGWEAFCSAYDDLDGGTAIDDMFRVLREGASVGIHVVATAERAGLVGRLASTIDNRLVLRLADRGDFALIGLPARCVPPNLPPGRGFAADDLIETHVFLLDPDPSGAAQLAAFAAIAVSASTRDRDGTTCATPRRVDPLPARISLAQILAREPRAGASLDARVAIGVGGDHLDTVSVDFAEHGPALVIAGPPRSGRSTTLATLATGLRHNGWHVVGVTARPSCLGKHTAQVFDANDPSLEAALTGVGGKLALLVDDAELVTDTPAAVALDRLVRGARDAGHIVAIAGNTEDLAVGFRGFVVDARRSRVGVLLTPRSALDGEVLGVRLPRDTGGRSPAGRGLFVTQGETTAIQVALPC